MTFHRPNTSRKQKNSISRVFQSRFLSPYLGFCFGVSLAILGYFYAYANDQLVNIEGTYGVAHSTGVFDLSGGGGNGGKVILIRSFDEAMYGGSGLYVDGSIYPPELTGSLFIETVGWAEMIDSELLEAGTGVILSVSGYAWSPNAGYIDFSAQDSSYSGVHYLPGRQAFTGYAWSPTLGYIGFASGSDTDFKNRVKILGALGGARLYDTEYYLGNRVSSENSAEFINDTRRKIAELTRNLQSGQINVSNTETKSLNAMMYYKGVALVNGVSAKMDGADARSLVVEGGNIVITGDVGLDPQVTLPRTIIALRDEAGNGGNIYIAEGARNIYSSLVAEGSIYSGDGPGGTVPLYNDFTNGVVALPRGQLYIYGAAISRNTIGGASVNPPSCPYTLGDGVCTTYTATTYDWNFFRSFDQNPLNRSDKLGYDDYSIIIESDPDLARNPPPGM